MKGIDISYYQGNVDFSKIKKQFEFVIIRVGLGDNVVSQDDVKYKEYVEGCKKYNIPYAFYLISYAKRETGSESVQSEIDHMERIAKQYNPFAIFYDLEIYHKLGKQILTNFAIKFCDYFKNKGYKTGVYANLDWFRNYLDYNILKNRGYIIWLAHYSNKPGLNCDIWQYSDKGNVDGINTNTTDLDIMYTNIIDNKPEPQPVDVKVNIYYAVKTRKYGWLSEVENLEDYAGYKDDEVIGLKMRVDVGSIRYRVTTVSGKKLGWVTGCNIYDYKNGWAGTNKGETLATIEAEYLTPKDIAQKSGYKYLYYKVNNYPYQIDLIEDKKRHLDGYAGKKGVACTKFQAYIK